MSNNEDGLDAEYHENNMIFIKTEPLIEDILIQQDEDNLDDVIDDYSIDFEDEQQVAEPDYNYYSAKVFVEESNYFYNNKPTVKSKSTAKYNCSKCFKPFKSRKNHNKHVVNCTGKKQTSAQTFTCDLCSQQFNFKSRLKIHMTTIHLGQYSFECFCGKKFWAKSTYEIHARTHLAPDDRPFACTNCTRRFKSMSELDKHTYRMHTSAEEKPCYGCDECDFTSTIFESMEKHKLTHLPDDQKPFHCQYCPKGFVTKGNRDHHEMIHTNTKPYVCDHENCEKRFKTNAEMKEHFIREHTDIKPFVCELCNNAMKDRFTYRRHMARHERELGVKLDKSVRKFNVSLSNLHKK